MNKYEMELYHIACKFTGKKPITSESEITDEQIDLGKMEMLLDAPELIDGTCDQGRVFLMLSAILFSWANYTDKSFNIQDRPIFWKLLLKIKYLLKYNWDIDTSRFSEIPKYCIGKRNKAQIEREMEYLFIEYAKRKGCSAHLESLEKYFKNYRNTYGISLSDRVESITPQEKRAEQMFHTICAANETMVDKLVEKFVDFHNVPKEKPSLKVEIRNNIKKMFAVVANCPEYAYIFPVYVFLMFTRYEGLICHLLDNSKKTANEVSDKQFYIKLFFPKKNKRFYDSIRYTNMFEDIFNAIVEEETVRKQISEVPLFGADKGKIFSYNVYPLVDFEVLFRKIQRITNENLSEAEKKKICNIYGKIARQGLYNKAIKKGNPSTRTEKIIIDIFRMLSAKAYFPLCCGVVPDKLYVNAIKNVFQFFDPENTAEAEKVLEQPPEMQVKSLCQYYRKIESEIWLKKADISQLAFQYIMKFEDYQGQTYIDDFTDHLNDIFDNITECLPCHEPGWTKEVPDQYHLMVEAKMAAAYLESDMILKSWKSEDIFGLLLDKIEERCKNNIIPEEYFTEWLKNQYKPKDKPENKPKDEPENKPKDEPENKPEDKSMDKDDYLREILQLEDAAIDGQKRYILCRGLREIWEAILYSIRTGVLHKYI